VRDVRFSFYDDKLYEIVVTYDHARTAGLTPDDVIESLSAIYGTPLLSSRGTAPNALPADVSAGTTVVATWGDSATHMTLTQGTYTPNYQLALISKTLDADARTAIKEALRLDKLEAPQRELDRRQKNIADAAASGQKARVINKAAFRP
jgi:hypothetical protein